MAECPALSNLSFIISYGCTSGTNRVSWHSQQGRSPFTNRSSTTHCMYVSAITGHLSSTPTVSRTRFRIPSLKGSGADATTTGAGAAAAAAGGVVFNWLVLTAAGTMGGGGKGAATVTNGLVAGVMRSTMVLGNVHLASTHAAKASSPHAARNPSTICLDKVPFPGKLSQLMTVKGAMPRSLRNASAAQMVPTALWGRSFRCSKSCFTNPLPKSSFKDWSRQ
mmetsp:Transcript_1058/g.1986  ORF Transcript_1058/g.1986 Transcript_1058/m.1986 type:complete len:222 (-) Transcript_1058:876-1541(-)